MYLGRLVELAPDARRCSPRPRHPYTEALLSRRARSPTRPLRRHALILQGELRARSPRRSGCVFRTRCPYALPACAEAPPPLRESVPTMSAPASVTI